MKLYVYYNCSMGIDSHNKNIQKHVHIDAVDLERSHVPSLTRLRVFSGPSHATMLSPSAARHLEAKWLQWQKRPALLQEFLKKLLKEKPSLVPVVLNMALEKGVKVELRGCHCQNFFGGGPVLS